MDLLRYEYSSFVVVWFGFIILKSYHQNVCKERKMKSWLPLLVVYVVFFCNFLQLFDTSPERKIKTWTSLHINSHLRIYPRKKLHRLSQYSAYPDGQRFS